MVQLMQKFAPRSCVRIFRNECTPSTPLDTKLSVPLLYDTRFKTGRTIEINAKVQATKLRKNFLQQIHYPRHLIPNSCFGAIHSVWVHLGPFRYCMKLSAKWDELVQLMQKFVPQSRIRCFHNKRTQSTPLGPKLIFYCVS